MSAQKPKPVEDDNSFEYPEDNEASDKNQPGEKKSPKPVLLDDSKSDVAKPADASPAQPNAEDTSKLIAKETKSEIKPVSAQQVLDKKNEQAEESAAANVAAGRWRDLTIGLIIFALAATCVFLGVLM